MRGLAHAVVCPTSWRSVAARSAVRCNAGLDSATVELLLVPLEVRRKPALVRFGLDSHHADFETIRPQDSRAIFDLHAPDRIRRNLRPPAEPGATRQPQAMQNTPASDGRIPVATPIGASPVSNSDQPIRIFPASTSYLISVCPTITRSAAARKRRPLQRAVNATLQNVPPQMVQFFDYPRDLLGDLPLDSTSLELGVEVWNINRVAESLEQRAPPRRRRPNAERAPTGSTSIQTPGPCHSHRSMFPASSGSPMSFAPSDQEVSHQLHVAISHCEHRQSIRENVMSPPVRLTFYSAAVSRCPKFSASGRVAIWGPCNSLQLLRHWLSGGSQ